MTSSDPFALLGLDRKAATDADVRRAYAEKLKATRPDEDPAGFMALREAYDVARQHLRWRAEKGWEDEDESWDEEAVDVPAAEGPAAEGPAPETPTLADWQAPDHPYTDYLDIDHQYTAEQAVSETPPPESADPVGEAVDRVFAVLQNPFGSVSTGPLMAALDDSRVETVDAFSDFSNHVLATLCRETWNHEDERTPVLPGWLTLRSLELMDDHFGWRRQLSGQGVPREAILQLERLLAELRRRPADPVHARLSRRIRRRHRAVGERHPAEAEGLPTYSEVDRPPTLLDELLGLAGFLVALCMAAGLVWLIGTYLAYRLGML